MNWYYAKNGSQQGPVPTEDMKDRISMGEIAPTDLAWCEGMADWMPVSEIAELEIQPASKDEAYAPEGAAPNAKPSPYQPQSTPAPANAPAPTQAPVTSAAPVQVQPQQPSAGQPPAQGMAIGSMICGILGLVICCIWPVAGPLALVAIILGHITMSKIRANPAATGGKGMARVGLVTGYLGLVAVVVFLAVGVWVATLTPEKIDSYDWMPPETKQQMKEQIRQIQEAQRQGEIQP